MKRYLIAAGALAALAGGMATDARAALPETTAYCIQQGGSVQMHQDLGNQEIAYCRLPGNVSCNSWDLYRGACPGWPAASSGLLYDENDRLLKNGDLISAARYGDPDIFIIQFSPHGDFAGYQRLFLNPAIFSMYGHLGGFERVHPVTPSTRDLFETSGLFRNCESGDQRVYATEVIGEDDGILHHVDMSGAQAIAEDARFFDRVFCINSREEGFYPKSITAYRRLADIPVYRRTPVCTPLPACARPDANPRCQFDPQPGVTYCPYVTPPSCDPLPACARPGASPACSLTATSPNGKPWCPPPRADAPYIASITPTSGDHGTVVTLRGSGFSPTRNYVQFGLGEIGMYAATNGATTITFTVPEGMGGRCSGVDVRACPSNFIQVGAGSHEVVVESVYGSELRRSNAVNFVVRLGQCFVGGCSGQLCTDQSDVATTCEYRTEYACYQRARCERQTDGHCGWTQTAELQSCLANPMAN